MALSSAMDTLDVVCERYLREAIAMGQSLGLFDSYVTIQSRRRRHVYTITAWGLYGVQGYDHPIHDILRSETLVYSPLLVGSLASITGVNYLNIHRPKSPCLPTRTPPRSMGISSSATLDHRPRYPATTARLPGRLLNSG